MKLKIPKLLQNKCLWHRHSHTQGRFMWTINLTFADLNDPEWPWVDKWWQWSVILCICYKLELPSYVSYQILFMKADNHHCADNVSNDEIKHWNEIGLWVTKRYATPNISDMPEITLRTIEIVLILCKGGNNIVQKRLKYRSRVMYFTEVSTTLQHSTTDSESLPPW